MRTFDATDWPWCESCRSWHHPDNPTCKLRLPDYVQPEQILVAEQLRALSDQILRGAMRAVQIALTTPEGDPTLAPDGQVLTITFKQWPGAVDKPLT